ncbi:uncharacterized protein LOC126704055 [Quercus robur]|uniref:uncharacterized protein LOC126704055 n=1 Tax=Quercus robur TaxID=38942 RepID=UPI002162E13D|nr:uncharacterized protein LOC126704055 [Quercus robur]
MEAAKQRVRAAAARKKEEEKAKGKDGASTPHSSLKGSIKRKSDGKDDPPSKKVAVTPTDVPSQKSPPKLSHGAGKGVMTSSGPVIEGPRCLLTHKDHAVESLESLIKQTDLDPCAQLGTDDLGASAFFDIARALVRVKALQDRCTAKEGVVSRVRRHNSTLMDQQAQYKEAVRLLNTDLKDVKEKLGEAEGEQKKLEEEVSSLRAQVVTAGTDAVEKFKTTQSFIDSCADYYGAGFDDCLKQVSLAHPELDLSGITMDTSVPMTPAADRDDEPLSLDSLLNDAGVVLAQPAVATPAGPSDQIVKDKADGVSKDAPAT